MKRRSTLSIFFLAVAAACATPRVSPTELELRTNGAVEFAEEPATAQALERATLTFLREARIGRFRPETVEPAHRTRFRWFFDGIKTSMQPVQRGFACRAPVVWKSYPLEAGAYAVTLALSGLRRGQGEGAGDAGEAMMWKLVEIELRPVDASDAAGGYRAYCRFDAKTKDFVETRVGNVSFFVRGAFDAARAQRFVEFRDALCARTGVEASPMRYYKFEGLAELLEAHGLLYDRRKCNFLRCDLGFGDADGARFVTGMNREDNLRDYVYAHFRQRMPHATALYQPVLEGLAVCYGKTWGGVSLREMKARFARALEQRPDMDFLEEFRKGRGASVQRHFTFFFLGALIVEGLLAEDRFEDILALMYCGADGARFFALLEERLGISERGFHDAMLARMRRA